MRRKDREILNYEKMIEIMKACDCCRLGLIDADTAYILPLNFGYEEINGNLYLYFHGASTGKKIDLIEKQLSASFEMDRKHQLVEGDIACKYSYHYQSIMGKGTIQLVNDFEEKVHGLRVIMSHYSSKDNWEFEAEHINRVSVIRLDVKEWSCKEH